MTTLARIALLGTTGLVGAMLLMPLLARRPHRHRHRHHHHGGGKGGGGRR